MPTLFRKTIYKEYTERTDNIATESKDKNSITLLLWSARYRHKAVVELLLKKGAELEFKDKDG
jgi:ankyrin repeat protein